MSEISIASDHFWHQFKADIAGTLSEEQKGEIDRVLRLATDPSAKRPGDLRMSFGWAFVRLMWGLEKRSSERVKNDEKVHPVMTRRNAPMLASLLAGYAALWYVVLSLGIGGIVYFFL
ncbi:MAG TPA: hypothetical protein P5114_11125 [Hyphomicrobiaceae bacterium]|nr:hypothetical protein [Hyphomicrobiaceae bacterium]